MTMMKDDELSRLRAAFTAPSEAISVAAGCPEPDRIWEALRGELPPEEIREVVDHVALCASCAEDWRIAMAFEKESRNQQENVVPFPAPRRFQTWIAAAAAVLVLSVGGLLYQQTQKVAPEAGYRGTGPKTEAVAEQTCPRQACVLTWKPVEGAESYEVLVSTRAELATVADPKDLTTTRYQVPASALAGLPSGTTLQCIVTAVFPDGREEQVSSFPATVK